MWIMWKRTEIRHPGQPFTQKKQYKLENKCEKNPGDNRWCDQKAGRLHKLHAFQQEIRLNGYSFFHQGKILRTITPGFLPGVFACGFIQRFCSWIKIGPCLENPRAGALFTADHGLKDFRVHEIMRYNDVLHPIDLMNVKDSFQKTTQETWHF